MTIKTNTLAALMAGTFLSFPGVAAAEEITVDYLNSLTGSNVTWSETSGTYSTELDGKTFYYDYTPESGRTIYSERQNDTLSGNIDADFVGSSLTLSSTAALGGAIYNTSTISSITGNFIGNYAQSKSSYAAGGAIRNQGKIGDIIGNFIGDYAQSGSSYAAGGAIFNNGTIGDITGNFIGNYAIGGSNFARGGAIGTYSPISQITGDFISNYVELTDETLSTARSYGGAIWIYTYSQENDYGSMTVKGNFINNYAVSIGSQTFGGAIANEGYGYIGTIIGDFIGNYAQSDLNFALGGAVAYSGGYGQYDPSVNSAFTGSFLNNYAKTSSDGDFLALGGAVYTNINTTFNADGSSEDTAVSLFSGNYTEDSRGVIPNAIFVRTNTETSVKNDDGVVIGYDSAANDVTLSFNAINGGLIQFDDQIDGGEIHSTVDDQGTIVKRTLVYDNAYDIVLTGDGSGEIAFNNLVDHVGNLSVGDVTLRLGTEGKINTVNMTGGGTLKLDVSFADGGISTGVINVSGSVSGDYSVIANPINNGSSAYIGASSVFLTAPNDDATFGLARVVGSPYEWDVIKNTTDGGYSWSLELLNAAYAPEVYAGVGLQGAAIEQTRNLTRNVRNQVASHKLYCPGCGVYDYAWNGYNNRNVWVNVQGESANIDKPVKIDAKIWGVEAGFDLQNDINNTLGVFVSYRNGDYDLKTSDIDIDSYLAGLYYRYDRNMNWLFATVYGGVQKAEAQSDDKIAKFDTDGVQFGASVEAGHTFALSNDLTLDPSLGISYTQINFDDAHDNVSKEYNWKDVKHFEAELGAKLEKQIDYAKVYVKPSIIRTWTSGDSVKVTGLNKLSTYDDGTLGRVELGGRYGFTDAFSVYGWVNYTFGSDYDATAFGAGLNYAW